MVSFDMNEGMVGAVATNASKAVKPTAAGGRASTAGGEAASEAVNAATVGELDEDIVSIKRKTLAVKADNINDVFMENVAAITASVDIFQQMEEETVANDPAL